jgi:hypothetical protein
MEDITTKEKEPYNFMNDDIDDDIDFQIYIQTHSNGSSICDGDSNSDNKSDDDSVYFSHNPRKQYQKLTYEEVEVSIRKHYYQDKCYNELDMLITFVKGQKHVFRQSFYLTQRKVAFLVTPCLIITGSTMIFAPIIQPYSWSGFFLSALNAVLTIFISILNFWSLQFYMMQYSVYCSHFDRLETSLVLTRNKTFLLNNNKQKTEVILDKIRETETRMLEMKEDHPVYVPMEVKTQLPNISHIDIFSFIQKIEQNTKKLIIKYKDIKNEIRYIMYKWKLRDNNHFINENEMDFAHEQSITNKKQKHNKNQNEFIDLEKRITTTTTTTSKKEHERQRLIYLINQKETIKKEILDNHQKYSYIDKIFAKEIEISENNQNNFWFLFWYYIPFCNNNKMKSKLISLEEIIE